MPPRFAYWTILIDNAPTAFRARDAQELLPTLNQLKRTNQNVVMRWFSGGQLWDSPEAARDARRRPKTIEKRGRDWRPGGQHRDPRARFEKPKRARPPAAKKPWRPRPPGAGPRAPWGAKPGGQRPPKPWRNDRPGARRPPRGPRKRRDDEE
jgi:hypothetical protein